MSAECLPARFAPERLRNMKIPGKGVKVWKTWEKTERNNLFFGRQGLNWKLIKSRKKIENVYELLNCSNLFLIENFNIFPRRNLFFIAWEIPRTSPTEPVRFLINWFSRKFPSSFPRKLYAKQGNHRNWIFCSNESNYFHCYSFRERSKPHRPYGKSFRKSSREISCGEPTN